MAEDESTLFEKFETAKLLSAQVGFKIFNPSRRYFRDEHQFIGASNDTKCRGIFRVWVRNETLLIEFLPSYEDRLHQAFLEKRLGIKQRRYHPSMRRFNPAHKMVTAFEHDEFNMLVPNIRLS